MDAETRSVQNRRKRRLWSTEKILQDDRLKKKAQGTMRLCLVHYQRAWLHQTPSRFGVTEETYNDVKDIAMHIVNTPDPLRYDFYVNDLRKYVRERGGCVLDKKAVWQIAGHRQRQARFQVVV